MKKISAVMYLYNSEIYVKKAVESILKQTFTDFELIIIDDGSTDSSADIVRSIDDSRICFYQNAEKLGKARTLNRGINLSDGKFIAIADADYLSLPERFERQMQYFDSHPACALLGCGGISLGESANAIVSVYPRKPKDIRASLLIKCSVVPQSAMIRSSAFDKGELYFDESFEGAEDYELFWRISEKHEIHNIKDILIRHHCHEMWSEKKPEFMLTEERKPLKKLQMEALGMPTDTPAFEAFNECSAGTTIYDMEKIPDLVNYLEDIKAANKKAGLCDAAALDKIIFETVCLLVSKWNAKASLGLLKRTGRRPCEYGAIGIVVLKYKKRIKEHFDRKRKEKLLKNKNVTIISNTCWAGRVYEKYCLEKGSPTVGTAIYGEDYVKFCGNLKHYLSQKLVFFPSSESKMQKVLEKNNFFDRNNLFFSAMLDDVEIDFMHYGDEKTCEDKWYRRCKRVNFDNIVYKISEFESWTPDVIEKFAALPIENKLIFASKKYTEDTVIIEDLNILVGEETAFIEETFDEAEYFNSILKGGKNKSK